MSFSEEFSRQELLSITVGMREVEECLLYTEPSLVGDVTVQLRHLWPLPEGSKESSHPHLRKSFLREIYNEEENQKIGKEDTNTHGEGNIKIEFVFWFIGMTHQFSKDIRDIDRKIQGRILTAINDISRNAMFPRGDTIKPLTANKSGLWRYRIGNHRIIYKPDPEKRQVILVSFTTRSDAYKGRE